MTHAKQLISIIIPVYNEAPNIPVLHDEIVKHISSLPYNFEFIFIDDGSQDDSCAAVKKLAKRRIRLIELSRNFGKEAAVSAGLHAAAGDAAIILDADLQHPPRLINKFIRKWREGAEVVVGIKRYSKDEGRLKRLSSDWFYKILRPIANTEITPHAADYRLLDRSVIDAFASLTEHNRITRGLIDWLGFRREYVQFEAPPRRHGQRSYSFRKLFALAMHALTSYSLVPLRVAGYLGLFILLIEGPIALFLYIERYIMNDPFGWNITGTAMLALMVLFLIGVVLACLGLIALYIAHILAEVTNRPLYVVRRKPDIAGQFTEEEAAE